MATFDAARQHQGVASGDGVDESGIHPATSFIVSDLQAALTALASMISRTEKGDFAQGSSQHTLQRNRLAALRLAEELTKAELEFRSG